MPEHLTRVGRPPTCDCGECAKCRANRAWREWYRRRTREENRARTAARAPVKRDTSEYMKKNPEKHRAHTAVARAIADGRLTKGACEVCGEERADAHHDDYSKPLDVRWLCRP